MHHVCADKLNVHRVARVDFKFGGRIGKLSRFNPKDPLLKRNRLDWQRSECHHQSSHYKEEKMEIKAHQVRGCWKVRTWRRSHLHMPWLLRASAHLATSA